MAQQITWEFSRTPPEHRPIIIPNLADWISKTVSVTFYGDKRDSSGVYFKRVKVKSLKEVKFCLFVKVVLWWVKLFYLPRMPGGLKSGTKQKSRPVKVKKQKKKYIRSKDPIQAVLMWGVQHSVSGTSTSPTSPTCSCNSSSSLPSSSSTHHLPPPTPSLTTLARGIRHFRSR